MGMSREEMSLLEAIRDEGMQIRAYVADMALRTTLALAADKIGVGLPAYALEGHDGLVRFAQKIDLTARQIPRRLRAKRFNAGA